jgi:RHS repeat-associated protein
VLAGLEFKSPLPGLVGQPVVPSRDGRQLYVFDWTGRHQSTIDAVTNATVYSFGRDSEGRLVSITDAAGGVTTVDRDGSGLPTSITGPLGTVTRLTSDPTGHLQRVEDAAGGTIKLAYANDLLTTLTDENDQAHSFSYDPDGRLNTDTSADAGYKKLVLNDAGDHWTVASTSALGATKLHDVRYDAVGTTTTLTLPDGTSNKRIEGVDGTTTTTLADGTTIASIDSPDSRFGYSSPLRTTKTSTPFGLVKTAVKSRTVTLKDSTNPFSVSQYRETRTVNGGSGASGETYTTTYNVATQTRTIASGAVVTTEQIDVSGRVLSSSVPGLAPITFTYDPLGRPTKISQSARSAKLDYGADGFLWKLTDPLGYTTRFLHDGTGRVTSQYLPTGDLIQVSFDAAGNVKSVTPPGRTAHGMTYDPDNRLATYSTPTVGTEANVTGYFYDLAGKRTLVAFADGTSLALGYDSFQRLSTESHSLDSLTYGYDAAGRVSTLATSAEGLSFGYDGALLASITRSGLVGGKVTYAYDAAFRPAGIALNASAPIAYSYDSGGRVLTAGALTLTRDPQNGLVTGATIGVLSESMQHNEYGEPKAYTVTAGSASVYALALDRDLGGRIKTKTETISGVTTTQVFGYDAIGRLADVAVDGVHGSHYDYDPNGNRLAGLGSVGSSSGTYDEQDRIKTYGASAYTFTPNGWLKSKTDAGGTTTYVYDVVGNLRSVTPPSGPLIDYILDGQNRRVGKKIGGSIVQGFLYGKGIGPLAELDGSGATVATFVYATKSNVPDYLVKGGRTYRVVTDQVGSVRAVIDSATGTVAQHIDYDEFGVVRSDSNPGFQPFGFAGGLYDRDTALVRFGARDYDAQLGRWTSRDPIRFGGGQANLYVYAGSDPVNEKDANGRRPVAGSWLCDIPFFGLILCDPIFNFPAPGGDVDEDGLDHNWSPDDGDNGDDVGMCVDAAAKRQKC